MVFKQSNTDLILPVTVPTAEGSNSKGFKFFMSYLKKKKSSHARSFHSLESTEQTEKTIISNF